MFRLFAAAWPMALVFATGAALAPLLHFLQYFFDDEQKFVGTYGLLIFSLVRRALALSLLAHLNNVATAGKRSTLDAVWTGFRLMPRSLLAAALYAIGALILLVVARAAAIVIFAVLGSIAMTDWTEWAVRQAWILLLVPGLIWIVSLAFNQAAIVIDDARAVQSLKTSHALTKKHWWRTAAILTVLLLMNLFTVLPGFMGGVVLAVAGIDSTEVANQTLAFLTNVVTTAWTAAAMVSMYHDLKLRCADDGRTRRAA